MMTLRQWDAVQGGLSPQPQRGYSTHHSSGQRPMVHAGTLQAQTLLVAAADSQPGTSTAPWL